MIRVKPLILVLASIALSACATHSIDDTYYSLVLAADEGAAPAVDNDAARQLLLGPVVLPDYLDQRGINMQIGSSRIQSANHHFWAEPLDEGIGKVLVQDIANVSRGLAVDRQIGREKLHADCRLGIEFDKFHATDSATVVSSGRFWLSGNGERVRREFDLTRPLNADGYGHAVDTLRASLRSVAEMIGDAIDSSAICGGAGV